MNLNSDNSLQDLYRRNLVLLGWVTVLFLFPFMVYNLTMGHIAGGILMLGLIIIAAANALSVQYYKHWLIPYWLFFSAKLYTLLYATYNISEVVLFWSYPLAFIIFFVQPRFPARVMSAILAISMIGSTIYLFEMELVARYAFTLLMLIMFCDVLVGVLIQMESKLSEQAIRDPLTNAHNRRYMNDILEVTIEEIRREFGPASLIMLDIDHFKKINDKYGHIAGDTVLVKLVDLLHKRQRKLDYVFRAGGEEFVLILRNTGLQQAISLAENLRQNAEETDLHEGEKITISLGVAEYQKGETGVEWLHRADELLYEAKNSGRNCVRPAVLDELYN